MTKASSFCVIPFPAQDAIYHFLSPRPDQCRLHTAISSLAGIPALRRSQDLKQALSTLIRVYYIDGGMAASVRLLKECIVWDVKMTLKNMINVRISSQMLLDMGGVTCLRGRERIQTSVNPSGIVELQLVVRNPTCTYCRKATRKVWTCRGCLDATYCSRFCQSLDWRRHKAVCSQ